MVCAASSLIQGVIPMTNGGELAGLYCFAFFLLVFTGGGDIALDARRHEAAALSTV